MKLYRVNYAFLGTQADAKRMAKEFDTNYEQVEVPTDKEGLISYLNGMVGEYTTAEDEYETVAERQDPPIEEDEEVATYWPSADLQAAFEVAPITLQLELAVRAIDKADAQLRGKVLPVRVWGGGVRTPAGIAADLETEEEALEREKDAVPEDDEMFG